MGSVLLGILYPYKSRTDCKQSGKLSPAEYRLPAWTHGLTSRFLFSPHPDTPFLRNPLQANAGSWHDEMNIIFTSYCHHEVLPHIGIGAIEKGWKPCTFDQKLQFCSLKLIVSHFSSLRKVNSVWPLFCPSSHNLQCNNLMILRMKHHPHLTYTWHTTQANHNDCFISMYLPASWIFKLIVQDKPTALPFQFCCLFCSSFLLLCSCVLYAFLFVCMCGCLCVAHIWKVSI